MCRKRQRSRWWTRSPETGHWMLASNLRGQPWRNRLTVKQHPCPATPPLLHPTGCPEITAHRRPDCRRSAGQYAGQRPGGSFRTISVLREEPEPKLAIIRRRARLIGWAEALGQAAFGVAQKLSPGAAPRASPPSGRSTVSTRGPPPGWPSRDIGSVNAQACRTALRELSPDVVVVYGTRIIKRETLRCVAAPFINYHAGVNPKYRGQNGAYWARSQRDPAHAGVTVHLVDEGVDTGDVLYQAADRLLARRQHRHLPAPPDGRRPAAPDPGDRGCAGRPPRSAPRGAALAPVVPPHAVGLHAHRHAAGRVVIRGATQPRYTLARRCHPGHRAGIHRSPDSREAALRLHVQMLREVAS